MVLCILYIIPNKAIIYREHIIEVLLDFKRHVLLSKYAEGEYTACLNKYKFSLC